MVKKKKYSEGTNIIRTAEENQALARQREKEKAKLMEQGASLKQADKQVREQQRIPQEQNIQDFYARKQQGLPTDVQETKNLFQEHGVFNSMPIEQNQLVQPINTPEGRAQIEEQARKQNVFRGLISKLDEPTPEGGWTDKLLQIKAQKKLAKFTLEAVGRSIILARTSGDAFGNVPFIGNLISGILGGGSETVNNVKSSLDKRKELASSIAQDVKEGNLSPLIGLDALDSLEMQLNEAETIIQEQSILSPAVRRSGKLQDIQVTMLQQRQAIYRARQDIAGAIIQEADPEKLALRLEELKNA